MPSTVTRSIARPRPNIRTVAPGIVRHPTRLRTTRRFPRRAFPHRCLRRPPPRRNLRPHDGPFVQPRIADHFKPVSLLDVSFVAGRGFGAGLMSGKYKVSRPADG